MRPAKISKRVRQKYRKEFGENVEKSPFAIAAQQIFAIIFVKEDHHVRRQILAENC